LPVANPTTYAEDLALLSRAAAAAGDIALGYFRHDPKVWQKDNASPVTEADLAVDHFLKDELMASRPDYGWLSEETEDNTDRLGCERLFVVDPIDGTRGFIAGVDEWTISLAVVEAGRPVVAALLQPTCGRLYTATLGGGAALDGHALRLMTGGGNKGARIAGPAGLLTRLRADEPSLRPQGFIASLALRIAMVADGRIDVAVAKANANDWDIAAADLILSEAGGDLVDLSGADVGYNRPQPTHAALIAARAPLTGWARQLLGSHS
jgi:myo-inositol-1(or 4)-monophosphatase